jgi:hypothetical protein
METEIQALVRRVERIEEAIKPEDPYPPHPNFDNVPKWLWTAIGCADIVIVIYFLVWYFGFYD